jgi:hypothetical protein
MSWFYPIWGDSIESILAARYLMVGLSAPILATTYLLGRQLYGHSVGLLSVVLLSFTLAFLEKTIEIRPDVPEVACWMAGLMILVRAVRTGGWAAYGFAGLALGSALMFSQKAIFGVIGVLAALAWMHFDRRFEGRVRLGTTALFWVGCALPGVVTMLYFATHGALGAFIEQSVTMNTQWQYRFSPQIYFSQIVRESPLQVSLGIGGWVLALMGLRRSERLHTGALIPVAGTGATMIGLFIIPVPYLQFFQLLLPLWCIYAAGVLWRWIEAPPLAQLARCWNHSDQGVQRWFWAASSLLVAILFLAGLAYSVSETGSDQPPWIWTLMLAGVPLMWLRSGWQRSLSLACLLGAGVLWTPIGELGPVAWAPVAILAALAYGKKPRLQALALVLGAVIAFPLVSMARQTQRHGNQKLLNVIQYVLDNTEADEPVLTSWRGSAPFRPHAYFYFFLHEELQLILGTEELSAELLELLKETKPRFIEFDDAFRLLDRKLIRYVVNHYETTGMGVILKRRPDEDFRRRVLSVD